MKNWRLLTIAGVIIAAVLVAILTYSPKESPQESCGAYRSDKVVRIGSTQINTEVASTPAEQSRGLGGRPCIEPNQGMLFAFDKPGRYRFWMKDMKFPIDIVWINTDHKVVGLDINVAPSTYPDSFISVNPAQYVLELQANRSKDLGIKIGTLVNF